MIAHVLCTHPHIKQLIISYNFDLEAFGSFSNISFRYCAPSTVLKQSNSNTKHSLNMNQRNKRFIFDCSKWRNRAICFSANASILRFSMLLNKNRINDFKSIYFFMEISFAFCCSSLSLKRARHVNGNGNGFFPTLARSSTKAIKVSNVKDGFFFVLYTSANYYLLADFP